MSINSNNYIKYKIIYKEFLELKKQIKHKNINDIDITIIPYAAEHGYQNIIKWVINTYNIPNFINRTRGIQYASCSAAAKGGHLKILKFLRKNGFKWNADTTNMAAQNGNLELFQWVVMNNCSLGNMITINACNNGHIDILKWFYNFIINSQINVNDFYNDNIIDIANEKDYVDILEWLKFIKTYPNNKNYLNIY